METAQLHQAIEENDIETINTLTQNQSDILDIIYNSHTALTRMISLKSAAISDILSKQNIHVDSPDHLGRTPLYYASKTGDVSLVKLLISHGASINKSNPSLLHACAHSESQNNDTYVTELINWGVDLNSVDDRGRTPLHLAVEQSHHTMTRILLDNQAEVNAVDSINDQTPLMIAAKQMNLQAVGRNQCISKCICILTLLLKYGANVEMIDKKGNSALHGAVKSRNIHAVVRLLQHGASLKVKNEDRHTALDIALSIKDYEIAFILMIYGTASIVLSDSLLVLINTTDTMTSSSEHGRNTFQLLLEQGIADDIWQAHLNQEGDEEFCHIIKEFETTFPLSLKALSRNTIWRTTQIDICNAVKNLQMPTPLKKYILYDSVFFTCSPLALSKIHIAAYEGDIAFLRNEMKPEYVNIRFQGRLLIEEAVKQNNIDMFIMLMELGVDQKLETSEGMLPIHLLANHGNVQFMEIFLRFETDINIIDRDGSSAIHQACLAGHFDLATFLADNGANIFSKNGSGRYLIHYACASGNWKFTKRLLELNTPVDITDPDGYTGLHLAATRGKFYLRKNVELRYLFQNEIFLNQAICNAIYARDLKYIRTPPYAKCVDHLKVIEVLLESGCNYSIKCKDGKDAFQLSCDYGYDDIPYGIK